MQHHAQVIRLVLLNRLHAQVAPIQVETITQVVVPLRIVRQVQTTAVHRQVAVHQIVEALHQEAVVALQVEDDSF